MKKWVYLCNDRNSDRSYYYSLEDDCFYAWENKSNLQLAMKIGGMGGLAGIFAYPVWGKASTQLSYVASMGWMCFLGIVLVVLLLSVFRKAGGKKLVPENRIYIKPEMWQNFCNECRVTRKGYRQLVVLLFFMTIVEALVFAWGRNFFFFLFGVLAVGIFVLVLVSGRPFCYREARKRLGI